ncbi:MAG: hypothetical protein AAGF23_04560 [Acidobacteriota bacterium]
MHGNPWPGLVLALLLNVPAAAPPPFPPGKAAVTGAFSLAAGVALPHARSLSRGGGFEVEGGPQAPSTTGPASFGLGYEVTGGLRGAVRPDEPLLFGDDFETGDLSAWSAVVILP